MQNQTHFNPNAISSSVRPTVSTEQALAVGTTKEQYEEQATFSGILKI